MVVVVVVVVVTGGGHRWFAMHCLRLALPRRSGSSSFLAFGTLND
jgi:hypothetical protein